MRRTWVNNRFTRFASLYQHWQQQTVLAHHYILSVIYIYSLPSFNWIAISLMVDNVINQTKKKRKWKMAAIFFSFFLKKKAIKRSPCFIKLQEVFYRDLMQPGLLFFNYSPKLSGPRKLIKEIPLRQFPGSVFLPSLSVVVRCDSLSDTEVESSLNEWNLQISRRMCTRPSIQLWQRETMIFL